MQQRNDISKLLRISILFKVIYVFYQMNVAVFNWSAKIQLSLRPLM